MFVRILIEHSVFNSSNCDFLCRFFQFLLSVDSSAKIPVAIFNAKSLSKISLKEKYAGLGGHYLLLNKKFVKKEVSFNLKRGKDIFGTMKT